MPELPDRPNFYSTLHTELTPDQVAQLYAAASWQILKCGWTDFELASPVAELVIDDTSPLLMHGAIADWKVQIENVLAPLRQAKIPFRAECYGPDHELLRTIEG
jgi:hypothetical protein